MECAANGGALSRKHVDLREARRRARPKGRHPMKTIELSDAKKSLDHYVSCLKGRDDVLVIMRRGKPFAALFHGPLCSAGPWNWAPIPSSLPSWRSPRRVWRKRAAFRYRNCESDSDCPPGRGLDGGHSRHRPRVRRVRLAFCHSERSEESGQIPSLRSGQALHCAQDDIVCAIFLASRAVRSDSAIDLAATGRLHKKGRKASR